MSEDLDYYEEWEDFAAGLVDLPLKTLTTSHAISSLMIL